MLKILTNYANSEAPLPEKQVTEDAAKTSPPGAWLRCAWLQVYGTLPPADSKILAARRLIANSQSLTCLALVITSHYQYESGCEYLVTPSRQTVNGDAKI